MQQNVPEQFDEKIEEGKTVRAKTPKV